ncbi:MAG: ATP-binding cassette domain-containing protein [Planctomycetes bacterium]|nr:ATP-binding cassette domain-containing protein [Planctomycetota bacterium]
MSDTPTRDPASVPEPVPAPVAAAPPGTSSGSSSLATKSPRGGWTRQELERASRLAPVPPDKQVLMRIRDLHKHFGHRHILRGIDIDVYKGETLVILGGSGSGKTTLIRHIMGMLRSDAGAVTVGDLNLNAATPEQMAGYRRRMGVVFQMAALLNSLTILENVGLPLVEVDRLPADQVRARVIKALKQVFLPAEEILQLKPADLSGGMRKRVGIARAIIQNPEIILYDEPTTGLDPVTVNGVNELTLELQKSLGVTSIVITHDLHAAFMIADRIAMLYKGRMIEVGDKDQIKASQHPVMHQMLTGSTKGPLTEGYTS